MLHILTNGELEDIRPDETVDLRHGERRFIIVESDRVYRFTLNGERFDWPCRVISGAVLRKLGRVSDDKEIYILSGETTRSPHREARPGRPRCARRREVRNP